MRLSQQLIEQEAKERVRQIALKLQPKIFNSNMRVGHKEHYNHSPSSEFKQTKTVFQSMSFDVSQELRLSLLNQISPIKSTFINQNLTQGRFQKQFVQRRTHINLFDCNTPKNYQSAKSNIDKDPLNVYRLYLQKNIQAKPRKTEKRIGQTNEQCLFQKDESFIEQKKGEQSYQKYRSCTMSEKGSSESIAKSNKQSQRMVGNLVCRDYPVLNSCIRQNSLFNSEDKQKNQLTSLVDLSVENLQRHQLTRKNIHKNQLQSEKEKNSSLNQGVEQRRQVFENQKIRNSRRTKTFDTSNSPLKYMQKEMINEQQAKHLSVQKEQVFNDIVITASQIPSTLILNQSHSKTVHNSPQKYHHSHLKIRNYHPLEAQIDENKKFQRNGGCDNRYSVKHNENGCLQIRGETVGSFWNSEDIWENIIKDIYLMIRQEEIINCNEFSQQILQDFLNNVVGRHYQNNEKYMRESLILIGFTADVSYVVCNRISWLLNQKYKIENRQIAEFVKLFRCYEDHLSWNVIDYVGGITRVEQMISIYLQLVLRDSKITQFLRQMNISNDLIYQAFIQLFSEKQTNYKKCFHSIKTFFNSSFTRISHTQFFFAAKYYLSIAFSKIKLKNSLRNQILSFIEQMRFIVIKSHPLELLIKKQFPIQTSSQQSVNNCLSINQRCSKSLSQSSQQLSSHHNTISLNQEELEQTPFFCKHIAVLMKVEFMNILKIKQAIIKQLPDNYTLNYNNSNFECNLQQLIKIFTLNNHDTVAYYQLLNIPKYRLILLLTSDFFHFFSKILMDSITNDFQVSSHFKHDTLSRLNYTCILISRVQSDLGNTSSFKVNYDIIANIQTNYINHSCFFNELFNHPNPLELMLDILSDHYHNKSQLNQLCRFNKSHRSRSLCRYIICYIYPFVDSDLQQEFVSSYDFQCLVDYKLLQKSFFDEFYNVIQNVFLNELNLPENLVVKLLQEYSTAIQQIKLYSLDQQNFSATIRKQRNITTHNDSQRYFKLNKNSKI